MTKTAYHGARIFDGNRILDEQVLLIDERDLIGITQSVPAGFNDEHLEGGVIMPGFVDLQANGGGGVILNDAPTVENLRIIAEAHQGCGTRGFLPTLITDTREKTAQAIEAVAQALAADVPGVVGLHLEGPHLSVARKGAHAADLIRPMEASDEAFLIDAATRIPNLMVTVGPESVSPDQITRLSDAGIIVSLGHSDCSFDDAMAYLEAGARVVTHLFNAMSQMQPRAPGLVGAALQSGVAAGLIADGKHVHPANIATAMQANDALFLVTDAMATLGSDIDGFMLNGRRISRADGRLTLEDGTLAGADLTMARAIQVMIEEAGVALETALAMATARPADLLRDRGTLGALVPGTAWTGIYLNNAFEVQPLPA